MRGIQGLGNRGVLVYWIRGIQVFCINEDLALWTNKNKPYGKEKPKPYAQIKVTDTKNGSRIKHTNSPHALHYTTSWRAPERPHSESNTSACIPPSPPLEYPRMKHVLRTHLKQLQRNVIVHGHQRESIHLGQVRHRHHDSVQSALCPIHVEENGVVHVADFQRHLEITNRNTGIHQCKQRRIQYARQLAAVTLENRAADANHRAGIEGGHHDMLKAPTHRQRILDTHATVLSDHLVVHVGKGSNGHITLDARSFIQGAPKAISFARTIPNRVNAMPRSNLHYCKHLGISHF